MSDHQWVMDVMASAHVEPNEWKDGGPLGPLVSEAAIFKLAMFGKNDTARDFRRWLAHDVLPALRKHGCYPAPLALSMNSGNATVRPVPEAERPFERLFDGVRWGVTP